MTVAITDSEFARLKDYLSLQCGIDVPPEKRYLFVTRLADCLESHGMRSFSELHDRLTAGRDVGLHCRLIEAMTTNETSFFRDGHPFATLAREILPTLARRREEESRYTPPRLRIWCAGCSTGEEPYGVAMTVFDWLSLEKVFTPASVTILASDISRRALATARRGAYTRKQLGDFPARQRMEYLRETGDRYVIHPDVRAMVYFAEVNLAKDFRQLGFFDVIFCRNVIIYFALDLRRRILARFHEMLNPGGVLLVGASESLYQLHDGFRHVHAGPTTYYVRDGDEAEATR